MKRVLYGVFLILLAFASPWWVAVTFSIVGIFYFDNLYEVIFVGLIIDSLYGSSGGIMGLHIVMTIILTVSLYVLTNLKKRILI